MPCAGGSFRSSTAAPCASLWQLLKFNLDLYVWCILKYTCEVAVCAESFFSKYICFDCLVRIYWRAAAHVGDYWCHNVAWLHLAWLGVFSSIPPTPRLGHARMCAFWPMWSRGVGRVACNALTSLGERGPGPPPHPSIGSRTRAIICQYKFQFSVIIQNRIKMPNQNFKRQISTWAMFRI